VKRSLLAGLALMDSPHEMPWWMAFVTSGLLSGLIVTSKSPHEVRPEGKLSSPALSVATLLATESFALSSNQAPTLARASIREDTQPLSNGSRVQD
jgi:hypothetical protein